MKILHICLGAFYIDNYSYQENMLPKYHKELGNDVAILASLQTFDKNGNPSFLKEESEYINEFSISVKRIKYKNFFKIIVRILKIYNNIYSHIEKENPDIIFIHGCQFFNMKDVKKYAINHPNVKIFVDNHCDFSNSATNWFSKNILHKIFWRHAAKLIEPYTEYFYGVLPARVDFLINMYKLPKHKVKLLVMGADDEKIDEANSLNAREYIRKKYNINKDEFLIVTGGKIDNAKKQTILLMKAINNIKNSKVKLLVFGSIIEELQNEVLSLVDGQKIQYLGWINSQETYSYFAAADLAVFPGRHSVLWEQVVGQGIPIVVKKWEGTDHVDVGGNCKFLYEDSEEEIIKVIDEIINNKDVYKKMKEISTIKGKDEFSYKKIAKRSISVIDEE